MNTIEYLSKRDEYAMNCCYFTIFILPVVHDGSLDLNHLNNGSETNTNIFMNGSHKVDPCELDFKCTSQISYST